MKVIAVWILGLCAGAFAEEKALFDGRKMLDVAFKGRAWSLQKGVLECQGESNQLQAIERLGTGPFQLQLTLELPERNGHHSALLLGSSRLCFDGPDKQPFVEGPLFGGARTQLAEAAKLLQNGKSFRVELGRAEGQIVVRIDGQIVLQRACADNEVGSFGLSPGNARLRLMRWSVDGNLTPPPVENAPNRQPAIDSAVERGIAHLISRQLRDGSWSCNQRGFPTGQTALCVYTLLRAGLSVDHPAIARGLAYLDQNTPEETYSSGFSLMCWEATLDDRYKPRMEVVLENLLDWQRAGAWSYPEAPLDAFSGWSGMPGNPDLSNIQYAVLGLRAANHAGLKVPEKVWLEVMDTVMRLQPESVNVEVPLASGQTGTGTIPIAGFCYWEGASPSASMTAAGVSVLRICRQELGNKITPKLAMDSLRAIELGVNWLGYHFNTEQNYGGDDTWNYYMLYGIERVGTLGEAHKLGTHDWYAEGVDYVLRTQTPEGYWSKVPGSWHTHPDEYDTCFAILFLKRASRPVVRTGGPAQFQPKEKALPDNNAAVAFRASGRTSIYMWLTGFSDATLRKHGGDSGSSLRVARVEYLADGRVVASVEGNPLKGWTTEEYAVRVSLDQPGTYKVKARVHLVAADAGAEERNPSAVVESKEVSVVSDGVFLPWMKLAAESRSRNLLQGLTPNVTTSSRDGGHGLGNAAFDGFEATRWLCEEKDAAPTITMQLPKAVKARSLVLGPAQNNAYLRGEFARITKLSVRINKEKEPFVIEVRGDELEPIVHTFAKETPISRLEIRILGRENGRAGARAGFSDIHLEK